MRYLILLQQDEDGVWCGRCPSLPGCFSDGPSQAEAIANMREAIALYVESLEARGLPVPQETHYIAEVEA